MKIYIYMEGESSEYRPWDELTPDLLWLIFKNLWAKEVLRVIPLVCKSWCKFVEGPECWQRIDADEWYCIYEDSSWYIDYVLRMLILRSSGSLRELSVSYVEDDQMLFIAEHAAASLQTLKLTHSSISDSIAEQVFTKLSSLTTLDISHCRSISPRALESIGRNCPMLVSLTWNTWDESYEDEVWPIARALPKLKHLCITPFNITTSVVLEILSGYPELETLDIRGCLGVTLDEIFPEEKYPNVKVLGPAFSDEERSDNYEDDGIDYPLGEYEW